ncbi:MULTISPECIES: DUF2267 domain-containing protein [unclassified Streptomyces]|uniref:DUF2267 domain-containing protein n=1 Tax=unclassified Streptomyces TaxID=2593676 RepID=UPI000749C604|nr:MULTISPECIES: DUF2267 domain-containing protein [unclassified Streptomyces]KUL71110.1 hypothetical protein ADL33_26945 [Streptomyces sp. NRRL WC-3604]KUL76973.1 hypothetical protein ADL34_10895 [Streptomyces sp. NRRL WC-3605]
MTAQLHDRRDATMTYDALLAKVRYEGAYPTRERAEEVTLQVLAALGRQLTGDERVDLAARLPLPAALEFTGQVPATEQSTGWGFVKDLARRTGTSPAVARWNTGTVFNVLAHLTGPDLVDRILDQLPEGYALLFGRPELQPRRRRERQAA